MKKQRLSVGCILEIALPDSSYAYGIFLKDKHVAFFNKKFNKKIISINELEALPVLFNVAVFRNVLTSGCWPIVGKMEIPDALKNSKNSYIYHDFTSPPQYKLYITETGEIIPATKQECIGLEKCAVWAKNHIEDRLMDNFGNRKSIWGGPLED